MRVKPQKLLQSLCHYDFPFRQILFLLSWDVKVQTNSKIFFFTVDFQGKSRCKNTKLKGIVALTSSVVYGQMCYTPSAHSIGAGFAQMDVHAHRLSDLRLGFAWFGQGLNLNAKSYIDNSDYTDQFGFGIFLFQQGK